MFGKMKTPYEYLQMDSRDSYRGWNFDSAESRLYGNFLPRHSGGWQRLVRHPIEAKVDLAVSESLTSVAG